MSTSVVPQLPARETPRVLAIEPAAFLVPLGLFVAVVAVAAPNGSYFPSSWGWASLAFLWAAAIGLIVGRRVSLGRLEILYLGSWLALLAWTAASLLWSPATTQDRDRLHLAVRNEHSLVVEPNRSAPNT